MSVRRRLELGVGDEHAGTAEVGAVEAVRGSIRTSSLDEDALEDAADRVGHGGVGLEPSGVETLAPLAGRGARACQRSSGTS